MATKEDSCVKNRNPNRVLLMHKQLFNEKVAMVVLGVYMTPCQLHFSERADLKSYSIHCAVQASFGTQFWPIASQIQLKA